MLTISSLSAKIVKNFPRIYTLLTCSLVTGGLYFATTSEASVLEEEESEINLPARRIPFDLPAELAVGIFSFLEVPDLCGTYQVSRTWYKCICAPNNGQAIWLHWIQRGCAKQFFSKEDVLCYKKGSQIKYFFAKKIAQGIPIPQQLPPGIISQVFKEGTPIHKHFAYLSTIIFQKPKNLIDNEENFEKPITIPNELGYLKAQDLDDKDSTDYLINWKALYTDQRRDWISTITKFLERQWLLVLVEAIAIEIILNFSYSD